MRKVGNNPGRFCDIAAIDRDVKGRRPFWVVNRGGVGRGGRTDGKGSKMAKSQECQVKSREEEEE